jgi:hypothetical protein
MGIEDNTLEEIRAALAPHGILIRGVLSFDGDGPEMMGGPARTLVLLGNVGGSTWPAFSAWHEKNHGVSNPLDTWSVEVIAPVAAALGGKAWFPSDKPWQPFQQWARRAEGLGSSPLGVLLHPEYGPWHGYRAAIGFIENIAHDVVEPRPHPCDHCADTPCLTSCPVSAILPDRFEVGTCRAYLAGEGAGTCMPSGCMARNACPVGQDYRYPDQQLRFHMDALSR